MAMVFIIGGAVWAGAFWFVWALCRAAANADAAAERYWVRMSNHNGGIR